MPDLTVEGFPTITLFTAENKQVDAGEAERTLEGLTLFLQDHAATLFDLQGGAAAAAALKVEL